MAKRRWWRRQKPGKLTTPDGLSAVTLPPGYLEALSLYGLRGSYGYVYRTQQNVRAVVDFFSKIVGAMELRHFAELATPPGRPNATLELESSRTQRLLDRPAPGMARSRMLRATVADVMVYDVAYWQKVRLDGQVRALQHHVPTALIPDRDPTTRIIRWYNTTTGTRLMPEDLIVFHGYDPELHDGFTSPLEALRRILAEEYAAGVNREHSWRNSTRKNGVVERPSAAPVWDDAQREAWRLETEGIMSGGSNAGRLLLLEDDMKFKDYSWSPEEMEYIEGRDLTRQQCAAVWGIDPRLVFATKDAITPDVRTAFITDRLLPFLTSFAEELDVQLLPEMEPLAYEEQFIAFDVHDKLRGSFIEELKILATAAGGPFLTPNEARDRWDRAPIPGFDFLYRPLNSVAGGGPQASPQNPVQTPGEQPAGITPGGGTRAPEKPAEAAEPLKAWLDAEQAHKRREAVSEAVRRHLSRQQRTVTSLAGALGKRGSVTVEDVYIDVERWDRELGQDLEKVGLNGDSMETARAINEMTKFRLSEVLEAGEPLSEAFQWHEEVLHAP